MQTKVCNRCLKPSNYSLTSAVTDLNYFHATAAYFRCCCRWVRGEDDSPPEVHRECLMQCQTWRVCVEQSVSEDVFESTTAVAVVGSLCGSWAGSQPLCASVSSFVEHKKLFRPGAAQGTDPAERRAQWSMAQWGLSAVAGSDLGPGLFAKAAASSFLHPCLRVTPRPNPGLPLPGVFEKPLSIRAPHGWHQWGWATCRQLPSVLPHLWDAVLWDMGWRGQRLLPEESASWCCTAARK